MSALVLALLSRFYVVYLVVGAVAHLSRRIESIHLTYPAEPRFREAYTFQVGYLQGLYRALEWISSPIAMFSQGGGLGLALAVAADEKCLMIPENEVRLRQLLRRMRCIQRLVGAEKMTFAGLLPSHLAKHQIDTGTLVVSDPREATRCALLSAIDQVVEKDFEGVRPPILLFGGAGYIGCDLAKALQKKGDVLHIIDVKGPSEAQETLLPKLKGQAVIFVDVARRNAIKPVVPHLWPELVLLNETYPEPSGAVLAEIHARGVRVRHVAGVEGTMKPNLPGGYSGAVPCCAAHKITDETRAVLKNL
ncbi:hypothetical protein SAMN05421759_101713 [Roseivivax lentus]|uniref:Uncharacterized protein n=2 Tax=Roseivivax lentus TaxID=633194 RepID=A0A1N7KFQ0_9RHOB|nr:hypothetical protein SAMN05421759_101713 [Roseivivax lentus]